MNKAAQRRHELRQALEGAIERDELRLLFQPIVDLNSGQVVCLEALLRWDSDKFGEVSPTEFIPIAEESGLINPIGQYVLAHALAAAATWPSHVSVAVNLSPVQFRDEDLIEKIAAALASSGLKAGRLELEITEMTFLSASSAMTDTMRELKALGVSLALDDFGTGYSSLSYLRNFPFDKVKIDRSFLGTSASDDTSAAIVHTVIELGRALHMRVTAEGIEKPSQVNMLRAMGCGQIQGFIVSSAVPETEARALARGKHLDRVRTALGLSPEEERAGVQASAA